VNLPPGGLCRLWVQPDEDTFDDAIRKLCRSVASVGIDRKWPRSINQSLTRSRVRTDPHPMVPAHDSSDLHAFAGTWQPPVNL
jgi:hypothetical protein